MKLTDAERAENRKAFAEMTWPQRVEYIFEYYKFPLVLILIAAVADRKSTRLNSSHPTTSRMPSSA